MANQLTKLNPLSDTQLQMILGTMLGDGCFTCESKNPRYRTTHGRKQAEYCQSKADLLDDYIGTPMKIIENRGFGQESAYFSTLSTPVFASLYGLVCPGGKKTVTQEWLDQLTIEGISWWFQDDGSGYQNQITFSTHGFSHPECQLLAQWLTGMGFSASVRQVKRGTTFYSVVSLQKQPAWKLQEMVRPYIHSSMTYKLRVTGLTSASVCVQCGAIFQRDTATAGAPSTYCSDTCRQAAIRRQKCRWNGDNQEQKNQAERERYYRDIAATRRKKREQAASKRKEMEQDAEAKAAHLKSRRRWRNANKGRPEVKAVKAAQDKRYRSQVTNNPQKKAEQAAKRRAARERRMADPAYREKIRQQQITRRAQRTPEQIEENRRKTRERMRSSS